MKKGAIWALAIVILAAFIQLFAVQISYYNRMDDMRKEQFMRLSKSALKEVAEQVKMKEMARYLNDGLKGSNYAIRSYAMSSNHRDPNDTQTNEDVVVSSQDSMRMMEIVKGFTKNIPQDKKKRVVPSDTMAKVEDYLLKIESTPSEKLIKEYFLSKSSLDMLMLRYLYDCNKDSLAQMIDSRTLRSSLRYELDEVGICDPFYLQLYSKDDQLIYEYLPPGKLRVRATADNSISQRLFVSSEDLNEMAPYVKVVFINPSHNDKWAYAIPGMVSTLIVFILTVFALTTLFKQQSFQLRKTDFINNMTHELKTPVSSISLAGQMLRDEKIREQPQKMQQLVGIINSESRRLSMLIEKVLQFSLFEDARFKLKLKTVDANEIILSVAEVYVLKVQQTGGDLNLNLEAEDTWVQADEMHFTNVLFNLMDNAVKYKKTDCPMNLTVETYNENDKLFIIIEDNGQGIPKDSLKRIFERFYRVPTGNRHDAKGFGLGLAYVDKVVEMMSGRIHAESVVGHGTKMIIELPIAKIV
ncbi:HAMP domain-containing sensor histidine kinase [Porphyromonas pogonae]|uniref:sensor histidine kinase n=1 Tax=Porphyromonas pogonae TaxID=867595 RepID=UPI002E769F36|nr:HAMP domain-containing sensor histidine kinase [Porphyromonas pogonae]